MSSLVARLRDAIVTPVALASPLPQQECLRRLAAITVSSFAFMKSRPQFPLAGSVTANAVSLRYRISYRNDYQRRFEGRLEPAGGGSVLRGSLRPSLVAAISAGIIFAMAISFQIVLVIGVFSGGVKLKGTADDLIDFLPLGMLLFLTAIFALGLAIGRSADRKLLEILNAQLEASAISMAPPPPRLGAANRPPAPIVPR